jgi:peptidoglycan/xylan/chitin deacetylase (PgdA/CDA1 family)
MNRSVRSVGDTVLRWSVPQVLFRWRRARKLTVLAYHSIDDEERFAEHLGYVLRRMHPVTLGDVIASCSDRSSLPERATLVTFDDADISTSEIASPLLRDRGIPGVAFVVAGLVDTDLPFWWTEVEELIRRGSASDGLDGSSPGEVVRTLRRAPDHRRMAVLQRLRQQHGDRIVRVPQLRSSDLRRLESSGIEVGNHSLTHASLARCDDNKIRHEVHEAHRTLTQALGHPPRSFAYPDGQWDARVRQAVAEAGYEAAFLFDHRLNDLLPADPLGISRVRVDSTTSPARFATIVSGLHPAIHHARGRR